MNKIIQDMIPTKKKPPLREAIPVEHERAHEHVEPLSRRKKTHFEPIDSDEKPERARRPERLQKPEYHISSTDGIVGKRSVSPWFFGVIAAVCLIALVYAFSLVYARATVAVTPATIDIPVSGTYTAYANTAASGTIAYKIIQTSGQLTQSVPAAVGPLVTTYAKGALVLYNNYGSASQRIIAGTRLESGNGLIYTTNTAVVIPGISKGVAGSVAVNVTAAAGGSSYNIPVSQLTVNPSYGDFSIVAYKGTVKADGFYARLNPAGQGITGGLSGHQIVTATSSITAADQIMEQALQKSLLAQAQTLVASTSVLFNNGGYIINYTPTAASTTSSTTATIGMQATLYGIVFKKSDLAEAIAPTQYNSSFIPEDLDAAQFTVINPQSFTPTNGATLNFSLKGNLNLVGTFSTTTLARQLADVSLSQGPSIFKGYSAISTAHVTIVPFWKHSFPSSPSRINVVIQAN